jgi:hypothetical protein
MSDSRVGQDKVASLPSLIIGLERGGCKVKRRKEARSMADVILFCLFCWLSWKYEIRKRKKD